VSLVIEVKDKF